MSVKHCATASFNRSLERRQRLLVTYSMRDMFLREKEALKLSLPATASTPEHRGR